MQDNKKLSKKEIKKLRREAKVAKREKDIAQKNMVKNIWLIIIFVIFLSFIGFKILNKYKEGAFTIKNHSKGPETAKLKLVEYSDFQCPACTHYYNVIKELSEEYKDDLQITFKHFPLRSIHPKAQLAAQAAEAAGKQDKFWEMHDKLFDNQNEWSPVDHYEDIFIKYATELELDIEMFKKDLKDKNIKKIVDNNYDEAIKKDLNGTPSFFLNGERIKTKATKESFAEIFNKILEK